MTARAPLVLLDTEEVGVAISCLKALSYRCGGKNLTGTSPQCQSSISEMNCHLLSFFLTWKMQLHPATFADWTWWLFNLTQKFPVYKLRPRFKIKLLCIVFFSFFFQWSKLVLKHFWDTEVSLYMRDPCEIKFGLESALNSWVPPPSKGSPL